MHQLQIKEAPQGKLNVIDDTLAVLLLLLLLFSELLLGVMVEKIVFPVCLQNLIIS
jgi:hypothetical protein